MITVNEATKNYLAKEEILCILEYFPRLDSQKWPYSHKEEGQRSLVGYSPWGQRVRHD